MIDHAALRARHRQWRIDGQLGNEPLLHEAVAEALDQKIAQRAQLVFGDRKAGRHRMAPAIDEEPGLTRRDHRRTERDPGHRAARASAKSVGERDDAGRALISRLQPRRDDADNAGMPARGRGEDESGRLRRGLDLRDRRL